MDVTTNTVKLCVALILGVPLSVTRMLNALVLGDWPLFGVHVKMPLAASTFAPAGAPLPKLKVSTLAGISGSFTTLVKPSSWPADIVLFPIGERIGAELTSLTITVKRCVALKLGDPLSKTRTRMLLLLGPCASLGLQVKMPLAAFTVAPAGADTIWEVSILGGTSASVADVVNLSVVS